MSEDTKILEDIGEYKYGFHDRDDNYVFKSQRGLSREVVENISRMKGEPQWMLEFRLKALAHYMTRPMPTWGPELNDLDLDNIFYYVKPTEKSERSWDDVPDDIKRTFDKLGIPEAERKFLAGVGAQYDSEVVYHNIHEDLKKQGVIFLGMGQFERTMIIAEPGSYVHYVEGCTAPIYSRDSLHSAVVEIIVKEGARVRYTTIQNWSPSVYLMGPGAHGEILSLAFAGPGQHQDAGGKMIHAAPNTTSTIISKSISKGGGRTSYRGQVKVYPGGPD